MTRKRTKTLLANQEPTPPKRKQKEQAVDVEPLENDTSVCTSSEKSGTNSNCSNDTEAEKHALSEINKIRHGIANVSIDHRRGKKNFKTFSDLVEDHGFSAEQIYNVEKVNVSLKVTTKYIFDSTLLYSHEGFDVVRGHDEEKITVLLCTNAAGYKCKPLVVFKSPHKKAFEGKSMRDLLKLPVICKDNENGVLTPELFEEWIYEHFVTEVKENYRKKCFPEDSKTVLILDFFKCSIPHPAQESLVSRNIFAIELPPNTTTADIQSKGQKSVVVKALLQNYKDIFSRRQRAAWFEENDVEPLPIEDEPGVESQCYRCFYYTMDNAVHVVTSAWDSVRLETIQKLWKNLWPEHVCDSVGKAKIHSEVKGRKTGSTNVQKVTKPRTPLGGKQKVNLLTPSQIGKIRCDFQELGMASTRSETEKKHIETFGDFLKGQNFTAEQIYNVKESNFMWMCLPTRFWVRSWEDVPVVERNNERITLLLCANAAGHKCRLLVVCKRAHTKAFKDIDNIPVIYKDTKSGRITSDITREWFNDHFVAEVKENYRKKGLPEDSKTILLLDQCKGSFAHPSPRSLVAGNIFAVDLPPNVAPRDQPMAQAGGVIRELKEHYQKLFDERLSTWFDMEKHKGEDINGFHKAYFAPDAVERFASAWEKVKQMAVQNVWKNLWPDDMDEDRRPEDDECVGHSNTSATVQTTDNLPTCASESQTCDVREEEMQQTTDEDSQAALRKSIDSQIKFVTNSEAYIKGDGKEESKTVLNKGFESKINLAVNPRPVLTIEGNKRHDEILPKKKFKPLITRASKLKSLQKEEDSEEGNSVPNVTSPPTVGLVIEKVCLPNSVPLKIHADSMEKIETPDKTMRLCQLQTQVKIKEKLAEQKQPNLQGLFEETTDGSERGMFHFLN